MAGMKYIDKFEISTNIQQMYSQHSCHGIFNLLHKALVQALHKDCACCNNNKTKATVWVTASISLCRRPICINSAENDSIIELISILLNLAVLLNLKQLN